MGVNMNTYSNVTTRFLEMVRSGDFLVLDTETTGLQRGEIVQIAIVDSLGSVLLDEMVKPYYGIPFDATAIHGITNADVEACRSWREIAPHVADILTGRDLVVYNAVYDRKMMHQSAEAAGMQKTEWKELAQWWCAMEAYAEIYGAGNDYKGSFTWQRLTAAMSQQGLPTQSVHSALGDALMTLALVRKVAKP
jgi:DNA polymerase III epsilon subunit-like protein